MDRRRRVSVCDDILMQIILCLPVKSLIRFRSVSKRWRALISSDDFWHTLRRLKLQQSLILEIRSTTLQQYFYFNGEKKKMIPFSLTDFPDLRILHACNGLLLLESTSSPCSQYTCYSPTDPEKTFIVYNPATRQSRTIKLTRSNDDYLYVADINLAFDPSKSPHYKIVCLKSASDSPNWLDSYTFQIEVYDSESETWMLRLDGIEYHRMQFGEYWNRGIFWISTKGCLNFDIANNKTETFTFPKTLLNEKIYRSSTYYFQALNGHLYHFVLVKEVGRESVSLWELGGEVQLVWSLKYYRLLTLTVGNDCAFGVRLVGSNGHGVCLLTCLGGKIRAYNFPDGSDRDILDLRSQPFYQPDQSYILKAFQYGETLTLV